jgi:hypothetical protein
VRYELLLQSLEVGAPYDPAPVEALLAARGLTDAPGGGKVWRLKAGEIEVRQLVEGGKLLATELRAPLSDKLDLIRELVVEGAALAAEAKVRLFDPQISKTLTASDEGLVADQYLRTAKYAGEMLGVSEAVNASFSGPDAGTLKPGTKVLLGLGAFLLVLYLLADNLLK